MGAGRVAALEHLETVVCWKRLRDSSGLGKIWNLSKLTMQRNFICTTANHFTILSEYPDACDNSLSYPV